MYTKPNQKFSVNLPKPTIERERNLDYESSFELYNIGSLQRCRSLIGLTYLNKFKMQQTPIVCWKKYFFGDHERMKELKDLSAAKFIMTCKGSNSFTKRTYSLYNVNFSQIDIFNQDSKQKLKNHISKSNCKADLQFHLLVFISNLK